MRDRDMLEIVWQASSIAERLASGFVSTISGTIADERLETWLNVAADGDWMRFKARLSWDGWNVDTAKGALGSGHFPDSAPLPAWAHLLSKAFTLEMGSEQTTFLDPDQPQPFEDLLLPWIFVARQGLKDAASSNYDLLRTNLHTVWEKALLQTLASGAASALHLEFSILRTQHGPNLPFADSAPGDERNLYRKFVAQMQRDNLLAFYKEYAVLARLLATIVKLWIEANAEFLDRLAAGLPEIQRVFGEGQMLGPVEAISPPLSDPHHGRRGVIAVTFASGVKVIYKPKNLGLEEAYLDLLRWWNTQGAPLPFKVVNVLNCKTHGWIEFVEQLPVADLEAAKRYYQRAGALLCVAYVLGASDCHSENIVAYGEDPILIDMETILQPTVRSEHLIEDAGALSLAYKHLDRSVYRSWILPYGGSRQSRVEARLLSGIPIDYDEEIEFETHDWINVNTDTMRRAEMIIRVPRRANVPLLKGQPVRVNDHIQDMVAGFQQMYRFVLAQRTRMVASGSPLHTLADKSVRLVYRNTRAYSMMQTALLNPKYLRDGADRSIYLEKLTRDLTLQANVQGRPLWWAIIGAERQALEQLDIPLFAVQADADSLEVTPGVGIKSVLRQSGFAQMLNQIDALSQDDLRRQTGYIEAIMFTCLEKLPSASQSAPNAFINRNLKDEVEALSADNLVLHALDIAGILRKQAFRAEDGGAAWLGYRYIERTGLLDIQPINFDLYGGASGIALFLAAVAKLTGDAACRELALSAVKPLEQEMERDPASFAEQLGIGGATGLGSVIYALTHASQMLEAPHLLDIAQRVAALLTAERVHEDILLDITAGSAGAMLGLLKLYQATGAPILLEQADQCGRHLLGQRIADQSGYRAWPTIQSKLLSGFSHGAAGISYALIRLYEVTQDKAYLDAANEGFAYENTIFLPELGNWEDLRLEDRQPVGSSWCHGAMGIGLARLGALPLLDSEAYRRDIEIAITTTSQLGLEVIDHVCCGNMGDVELFLLAAQKLQRPEFLQTAYQLVRRVIDRAEETGNYVLHPMLAPQATNPDFFRGIAGIGYQLLRLAYPDESVSVLLWE